MTGQPQDRDERTGAELLREAARSMREDWDTPTDRRVFPQASAFYLAVADWLDGCAARAEITSRKRLELDQEECDWYDPAVSVARAYLAAPVSAGEPKEDA